MLAKKPKTGSPVGRRIENIMRRRVIRRRSRLKKMPLRKKVMLGARYARFASRLLVREKKVEAAEAALRVVESLVGKLEKDPLAVKKLRERKIPRIEAKIKRFNSELLVLFQKASKCKIPYYKKPKSKWSKEETTAHFRFKKIVAREFFLEGKIKMLKSELKFLRGL